MKTLTTDVNMFIKHVINDLTKSIYYPQNCKQY